MQEQELNTQPSQENLETAPPRRTWERPTLRRLHVNTIFTTFNRAATTGNLYRLLSTYVMIHDLGWVGFNKVRISLTRNDYVPDICFFNAATVATFQPDQVRFPAPDLAVAVLSASTETDDRGIKFEDYAAHGVSEYWIIDPDAEIVEQYYLAEECYNLVIKAQTGELQSTTVPDFVIPVRAIFDDAVNRGTLAQIEKRR